MIENILVYKWNSERDQSVIRIFGASGLKVVECEEPFSDDHADAAFAEKILSDIQKNGVQLVFSWNYLPLLASVCEMSKIPYAAWICDCPLQTLSSKTVLYKHNFLFCFDRVYANRLAELGCENVYHFPLAVDVKEFEQRIAAGETQVPGDMEDISFVDGMEGEKNPRLEAESVSEYTRGYVSGLVEAQLRVYGYNFVREMLREDMAQELSAQSDAAAGEMYFSDPVQSAADLVNAEITRKEKETVKEEISKRYNIKAYPAEDTRLPIIVRGSRINLYVVPKTVESGIPFPVLDILASGGFCLMNYQPEVAEFFEDGAELAMYTDMEELINKVDYYLGHEEERAAIAEAGNKKIREFFCLQEKITRMLAFIEGECV